MASFSEKVRARRIKLGMSQPSLGKAAGLSYQAIQQIESGDSKSTRKLVQLAEALKVSARWLTNGDDTDPPIEGGAEDASQPLTTPTVNIYEMPRDLPILGGAACGEDGMFELNGQVLDHARRPPRLMGVKDAYALWVMGESMIPWRRNGGLVMVHPHQPVNVLDYVVVQLKRERDGDPQAAYIKQLVRRTAKEIRLLQFNPRQELSIPVSKVHTIHRIPDWDELLGM